MEIDLRRSYVARRVYNDNIVIVKMTDTGGFFWVNPTDGTGGTFSTYELLIVEASCGVAWATHDTSNKQPVPKGALVGGILTATNTPLYVARQDVDGRLVGGYYNPLNVMAWGAFSGTKNNTVFEIMVVL